MTKTINKCPLRGTIKNFKFYQGFTLAEVLITLGIIGIVAAMTMPSLVANYQKKVLSTQLKKQVSVLANNFKWIMAEEGVDNLTQTPLNLDIYGTIDMQVYKETFGLMNIPSSSVTLTTLKSAPGGGGGENNKAYVTKDGAILAYVNSSSTYGGPCHMIDVNGDKGPNKGGLDRFAFKVSESGFIENVFMYPAEAGSVNNCVNDMKNSNNTISSWYRQGADCFAKVKEDGWEINY